MTTGKSKIPLLFSDFLIALPIACTISTCDLLGSAKTTASKLGTSTPSLKHLAFESRVIFLLVLDFLI